MSKRFHTGAMEERLLKNTLAIFSQQPKIARSTPNLNLAENRKHEPSVRLILWNKENNKCHLTEYPMNAS